MKGNIEGTKIVWKNQVKLQSEFLQKDGTTRTRKAIKYIMLRGVATDRKFLRAMIIGTVKGKDT